MYALPLLICSSALHSSARESQRKSTIKLKLVSANMESAAKIRITYSQAFNFSRYYGEYTLLVPNKGYGAKWKLDTDGPLRIVVEAPLQRQHWISYPGDSLIIEYNDDKIGVTGLGSERVKAQAHYQLEMAQKSKLLYEKFHLSPTHISKRLKDLPDFRNKMDLCDSLSSATHRLLDTYEKQYPDSGWAQTRASAIALIESTRSLCYINLNAARKRLGVPFRDIRGMYETEIENENFRWLMNSDMPALEMEPYYEMMKARCLVYQFDPESPEATSLRSEKAFTDFKIWKILHESDRLMHGRLKDQFMAFLLSDKILRVADITLADTVIKYLDTRLQDKTCLSQLKEENDAVRSSYFRKPDIIQFLGLQDNLGQPFTLSNLGNTITVLGVADETGKVRDSLFQAIVREFKGNPHLRIGIISSQPAIDTRKQKTGNMPGVTTLSAPATNDLYDYMQTYNAAAPGRTLMILPYNYRELRYRDARYYLPNPTKDTAAALLSILREKLLQLKDGPYVQYSGDTTVVYHLDGPEVTTDTRIGKKPACVHAATHEAGKSFRIPLKTTITPPASQYKQPEKIIVLSDMEGNLPAMAKFLIRHGVIDDAYNWIFGSNHLVLNGDFMDRGFQVTECLWLLYKLEDEAAKSGGQLHFILGNHEIMNLGGDVRYVREKYLENARLMHYGYDELLGLDSELGRWLRSRNMLVKIGDNLFVHGGISPTFNTTNLQLEEINQLSREFLQKGITDSTAASLHRMLHMDKDSPLWYRGYYAGGHEKPGRTPEAEIDKTLSRFQVSRIITGHTIVADVSSFYGGKVIDVDTHHASGDVEGLLIEHDRLRRITADGSQHPVMPKE